MARLPINCVRTSMVTNSGNEDIYCNDPTVVNKRHGPAHKLTVLCSQAVGLAVGLLNFDQRSAYIAAPLQCLRHLDLGSVLDKIHPQRCPCVGADLEHTCMSCATESMLLGMLDSASGQTNSLFKTYASVVSQASVRLTRSVTKGRSVKHITCDAS